MMSVASTILKKIQNDPSVDVTHIIRCNSGEWLSDYECEEIYKLVRLPANVGGKYLFWDGSILFSTQEVKGVKYHEYDFNPVTK